MSQRGAASRPPSRRRSQSNSTGANASPSSLQAAHQYRNDGGVDPARDSSRVLVTSDELPPRQTTPRTLGVHTILNPSEPRDPQSRTSPSLQRAGAGGDSSPSSVGTRQYGVSGSPYQPYGAAPVFGAPPGPTASLGLLTSIPPPGQRESPNPARPLPPALGAARRILTPRSPRSLSFSRVATPSALGDAQPPFDFSTPTVGRFGATQEILPFSGPPGPPSSMPSQSPRAVPPTPAASSTTMDPRAFSQAAFPNTPTHPFPQGPTQIGTAGSPQRMAPMYVQGQFESMQGSGRGYTHQGSPPAEANLSSAIMNALQIGGGATRGPDAQPHLTLQTNTGEHITVPLDVHQGSRQADEKRHRNAGASARFRARKKERDKDLRENMQRLENDNRELGRQNHELQAERDYYRSERNRLRDVVLRTPSIREHAEQGPPSPQPTRAAASGGTAEGSFTGSFAAGGSSTTPSPSLAHQQRSPPYADEALERPSRRRRTDPTAADFSPAPYAIRPAPPSGSLPPIVTQGYTGPISSAPPSARLPPLRFDQPASSPTTVQPPGFESQTPPMPQHAQYYGRPPPHEMGWATGARESQDPSRR